LLVVETFSVLPERLKMRPTLVTTIALAATLANTPPAHAEERAASLRGSPASMQEQNRIAKQLQLNFYRTNAEILDAVMRGELAAIDGNENYEVADFVRMPYLHPAAKLFVERLGAQYREACGQKLVVTSAVRPTTGQPRNAHTLSVHPAGMAVDLRVSDRASCRSFLENALLGMERNGLLNGIREFHPPHYHVAVYPEQYMAYAAERIAEEEAAAEAERLAAAEAQIEPVVEPEAALLSVAAVTESGPSRSKLPLLATLAVLLVVPVGRRVFLQRIRIATRGR
jgi:hypothetical protein